MSRVRRWAAGVLVALSTLVPSAERLLAEGQVTPSFAGGGLTIEGEDYRPGERVAITVRVGGRSHAFSATADREGRFDLRTGLAVPPLAGVELEARDEAGLVQATTTTAPPAPASAAGTATRLPRTGDPGIPIPLPVVSALAGLTCGVAGLAMRVRIRAASQ